MQAQINFNLKLDFQNQLDIEDVGNIAIEGINEAAGFYYYLLVFTSLGKTHFISYGPIVPDCSILLTNFVFNYTSIKYNDRKIEKLIGQWLNDKTKGISAATITTNDIVVENCIDIKDTIRNLLEGILN